MTSDGMTGRPQQRALQLQLWATAIHSACLPKCRCRLLARAHSTLDARMVRPVVGEHPRREAREPTLQLDGAITLDDAAHWSDLGTRTSGAFTS